MWLDLLRECVCACVCAQTNFWISSCLCSFRQIWKYLKGEFIPSAQAAHTPCFFHSSLLLHTAQTAQTAQTPREQMKVWLSEQCDSKIKANIILYQKWKLLLDFSKDGQCWVSSSSSSWNTHTHRPYPISVQCQDTSLPLSFCGFSPAHLRDTCASSRSSCLDEQAWNTEDSSTERHRGTRTGTESL